MLNKYLEELNRIYNKGVIKEVYSDKEEAKQATRKIPKRRLFEKGDFLEIKKEIQDLTERYFNKILPNELKVDFKIGMPFNLSKNPWIMIYSDENQKATSSKSTYMGIDFHLEAFGEKNTVKIWIGQGVSNSNTNEIIANRIQLVERIKDIIGDKLNPGFDYIDSLKDSSGFAIKKENIKDEEFENDVKYLSKKYLEIVSANLSESIDNSKNILIRRIDGLDYIYKKYLNHVDEKYYSLIVFKPNYEMFLSDLGIMIKKAIMKKNKDYYLIMKDIDKYPIEYLQELMILLNRNKNGETKYALNNSYLSNMIYDAEDKKVWIPRNLIVIATSTNQLPIEIEELFNIITTDK